MIGFPMERASKRTRLVSIGLAAIAFVALSGASVLVFRGARERTLLESRLDGERVIGMLFASLRNYDDFGAAIAAMPALSGKVIGVSVFSSDRQLLYAWGEAASAAREERSVQTAAGDRWTERYIENPRNASTIILLRPSPPGDRPPPQPPEDHRGASAAHLFMFDTLRKADVISLELRQPEYWRDIRVQAILFSLVEALIGALVIFVRALLLRNREYRSRIEQQKNLVLLGTAASTLAHEIKNPLLAIRLQSGILARTLRGAGERELAIIDDEISRLSALSQRVNDILRDPAGNPAPVDAAEMAAEVGIRLGGRSVVRRAAGSGRAFIDSERLRSVLENLLRNAMESGGNAEDVSIEVSDEKGRVVIDVLDRGAGLPRNERERLFAPFFTTKSTGSGIGLMICRRFVEAAGGTIGLEDRPGGGCRARVVVPAAPQGERA